MMEAKEHPLWFKIIVWIMVKLLGEDYGKNRN